MCQVSEGMEDDKALLEGEEEELLAEEEELLAEEEELLGESDIEADVEGGDEEELLSEPDDGLLGDELLEPAVEAVLEEVQTAAVIEDDLLLVPADILADLPPATDILADLPRAADILAELPDYPDSEEEEQKVRHIMKELGDVLATQSTPASAVSEDVANIAEDAVKMVDSEDEEVKPDPEESKRELSPGEESKRELSPGEESKRELSPGEESKRELSPGAVRKSKRARIEGPQIERYINKAGEFVTGFDPTSQEAKYRRQLRMQRFGKHAEKPKTAEALDEYHSSGEENEPDRRAEALHLYGTDDLSTDDILEYFREFSPHRIEWLDDSHCNVVWTDVHSVKRALLNMSAPFTGEELEKRKEELKERERTDANFVLVEGTLDRPGNNSSKWRLACNDHDKAHLLFMRFSTTADVKKNLKKGNYNNSRFYNLYGNPNLGTGGMYNNNDRLPFKKRQPKLVEEPSLVNEEVEKKKKEMAHVGDLRKHLNSGKIDLNKIQKIEKVEKKVEKKRSAAVVEVSSSSSSSSSSSDSSSSDSSSESDSDSSASSSEASEPQIISSRKVKQATIRKKVTLKVKRHIPAKRNKASPVLKRAISVGSSDSEHEVKRQKKPSNDLRAKLKSGGSTNANDLRAKLAARRG